MKQKPKAIDFFNSDELILEFPLFSWKADNRNGVLC